MDDIDVSLSGAHGMQLDPYFVPPKALADTLVQAYFMTLHIILPIISKPDFMEQYDLLSQSGDPFRVPNRWLSIINLVFAIGQRYFESMGNVADQQHLTFFMRARVLGALDGGILFVIPTLQDVQVLGLMGMYLLSSKLTNRYLVVACLICLFLKSDTT
jgi:hypothetical protein